MKVLVTGGAGFIGSHIVDALRNDGDEVFVVDSLDPGVFRAPPPYLRDDVDYCITDLRNWRPDERHLEMDAIIHLAALGGVSRAANETAEVIGANCAGTARLVEVSRDMPNLKRIVLAGSFSVYGTGYVYECNSCGWTGDGERKQEDLEAGRYEVFCGSCGGETEVQPITESANMSPLEAYGASKYMQELCFRAYDHCPVSILRFSSVYGDRLRVDDGEATIVAKLAGWIAAGKKPDLYEDGRQIRDWVYVGDVVDAARALINGVSAPPVVNVCSGVPITLVDACQHIATALGTTCEPNVVGGFRAGDMRHCLGDPSTLAALIGRHPIAFEEGASLAFPRIK
ncbi:MAG: NAD-dependent epimerase/dehydratase family protein [Gammaproteobacteria bacterium]